MPIVLWFHGVNIEVLIGHLEALDKREALVAYFYARQYLPFTRLKETLNGAFGIPISEGGIHCLLRRYQNGLNVLKALALIAKFNLQI